MRGYQWGKTADFSHGAVRIMLSHSFSFTHTHTMLFKKVCFAHALVRDTPLKFETLQAAWSLQKSKKWLRGNVCRARARRTTFVLSILSLAPSLSSPWEVPQVDRTRPCINQNVRIQQNKMSLPPVPTTTLAIVINWVQRMGQILRHGEKVLQNVW